MCLVLVPTLGPPLRRRREEGGQEGAEAAVQDHSPGALREGPEEGREAGVQKRTRQEELQEGSEKGPIAKLHPGKSCYYSYNRCNHQS